MDKSNKLIEMLFQTSAFKVAPYERPFWYTSGKIGPFYINTHYLYGSAQKAEDLLKDIDSKSQISRSALIEMLKKQTYDNYVNDIVYKSIIDMCVQKIKESIDIDNIKYISGGERRDWFFSVQCARLLNKEHVYLFKDSSCVFESGESGKEGDRYLHIVDLVTEASSYVRAWIPAIKALGGMMESTVTIVDRNQGGKKVLKDNDVELYSLMEVSGKLFNKAFEMNLIDASQLKLLLAYEESPDEAMKSFINEHIDFIPNTLALKDGYGGEKAASRAKLCMDKGFYV